MCNMLFISNSFYNIFHKLRLQFTAQHPDLSLKIKFTSFFQNFIVFLRHIKKIFTLLKLFKILILNFI